MDTSFSALQKLLDAISAVSKDVPSEMRRRQHQMRPIRTAFVHLRAYYGKVYYLANYICDEEQYSIQAVEEGKVEDIQDFLGEVARKAENCNKDLETLTEYLETERQTLGRQDEVAIKRKDVTQLTKIIGICTTAIGGVGIFLTGSRLLAISNDSDDYTSSTLALVGGLVVSIAFTIIGIIIATKGYSAKYNHRSNNQDEEQRAMQSFFNQSENKLRTANNHLKSATNLIQRLQDSQSVKSSLVQDIRGVAESARSLKEYCQELKDASSLEHFISYLTSKNTQI